MLNITNTDKRIDSHNGKEYSSLTVVASELSSHLREAYIKRGYDYNDYYTESMFNGNVGTDIYEYQNFFLLLKDGEYYLLDGFSRLLILDAPDIPINVRLYDSKDFTNLELLRMIFDLNHTKVFNYSYFHQNGFALFFHTVLNIDIRKIHRYISEFFRNEATSLIDTNGIVQDSLFIDIMFFISKMTENNMPLFPGVLGLAKNYVTTTDVYEFIEAVKVYNNFNELYEKSLTTAYEAYGSASSKVYPNLFEIYKNVFRTLNGKVVEKSYLEKVNEVKAQKKALSKQYKLVYSATYGRYNYLYNMLVNILKSHGMNPYEYMTPLILVYPIKGGKNHYYSYGIQDTNRYTLGFGSKDVYLVDNDTRKNLYIQPTLNVSQLLISVLLRQQRLYMFLIE